MLTEYRQQHVPHDGQRFGALQIVEWSITPVIVDPRYWVSPLSGMEFLLVESTGNGDSEYRRVGYLSTTRGSADFGSLRDSETKNFKRLAELAVTEARSRKVPSHTITLV